MQTAPAVPHPATFTAPPSLPRQILTIAGYTVLEALRNRLAWLFVGAALVGVGISGFISEIALTETRATQLSILAAFLRLAAVFFMTTFVVTSVAREFHDRVVDMLLSLALPRAGYLTGKLLGFSALALIPALLFGLPMALLAPLDQAALWSFSLACELLMVVGFSLLCILSFNQTLSALSAVTGFYVLARSISTLQLIGHNTGGPAVGSQQLFNMVVDAIAAILPRLDQFSRTEWLVYQTGTLHDLLAVGGQTLVYLGLLVAAALFDLYRKNF